jgi:hypothetical protein
MASTYTDYVDSDNGAQAIQRIGGEVIQEELSIDFSSFNVGAGDIVQLFNVAKGDVILGIYVDVDTAEGGAATGDIGITTTDPNGLDDAVNFNSTGMQGASIPGTDALVGYKMTAADTIDLVTDHALDAAKVSFRLLKATGNPSPASDSL